LVARVPTGRSVRYVVPMAQGPARNGRSAPPAAPRRGRPGYDLESLLAVAVTVFNERGYDGTSMEDLSRRLGIAKSSIYYHVDSKEDLLALALDRALDGLFSVAGEVRSSDGPAIERLERLVRGSVYVLADRLPYVTLLLRARGNSATERRALARRREFDQIVAELVAEAERDGEIRPDVDPAITARLLFGLVNSLVEWYRPGRRPAAASELADAVCAVAFDGLRIRGSARQVPAATAAQDGDMRTVRQ
jgi:AcrR family transcriptional regulator